MLVLSIVQVKGGSFRTAATRDVAPCSAPSDGIAAVPGSGRLADPGGILARFYDSRAAKPKALQLNAAPNTDWRRFESSSD